MNVDTESTSIKEISKIKKLTGTQRIRVEQKGQPAFDIELFAKLIFNCNELPTTSDNTDARFRREIIIEFPNQFEGSKDDPNLLKKFITDKEEMSGIFNLIVNSMRTIAAKNKIHVNAATISERRVKAKLIQNPIKAFLEDALAKEPASDDYETSDDMNAAFERFCTYNQISGPGHDKFLEDLKEKHRIDKRRKKIKDVTKTIWKCKLVKWKNPENPTQRTLDEDGDEDVDNDNDGSSDTTAGEEQPTEETQADKYQREQEEIKKW
jgi:putative DNA primase/helicase